MVPGTQVGAYRLIRQIGEGGMGAVWLAEHAMLGRRAAIKLLHAMYSARQDIVTRFFNEARAATAISDPGIVQIFDFGQHVDGTAYIAMEMLEGEPLDRRLARIGRFGINDAMRIMRQVAATLGAVHARGIVHRDLKPENVYLVRDPEVAGGERAKVLDFGIAKLNGDGMSKTNTSAVMGTPSYMSPEQCRGAGRVDQRADVYSLGCMLHALITGKPPFDTDEGAGEIIAMHLREQPQPPSRRAPGIPRELDALVLRCLEKDPARRFASGAELATALAALLGHVSSAPRISQSLPPMASMAPAPAHASTTLSSSSGVTLPAAARTRRWLVGAIAGTAVLVGVVVASVLGAAPSAPAPVAAKLPAPPVVAPMVAAPPPVPVKPDPRVALAAQMKAAFQRFPAWAKDHAGAPCPSPADLGAAAPDPWGHPLSVTCTDQPSNHVIGAVSAGPDGVAGNGDDVPSWELGGEVTAAIRGPRWVPRPVEPPVATRPVAPPPTPPAEKTVVKPKPKRTIVDDDIPVDR